MTHTLKLNETPVGRVVSYSASCSCGWRGQGHKALFGTSRANTSVLAERAETAAIEDGSDHYAEQG